MKPITFIIAFLLLATVAGAQSSNAGGTQPIQLAMSDVVGVSVIGGSGSGGGSSVDIPMSGSAALANGVESPEIQVSLKGNTNFDISVQASSTAFTYTGTATSNTNMLVKDVLSIEVTANNTGGAVANGFASYQPIDGTTAKKMIAQGLSGSRTFAFKYKATPGFNYSAGLYTTSIVYTITKI